MDFNKYMITKKWWQVSQFQVFDKDGQFVFRSATLGLKIRRMVFLNSSNDVFLLSKPVSTFSYNYNFIRDDTIIGSLERNWSSNKFSIRGINSDPILFKINYWNGDISIESEGVEIGKVLRKITIPILVWLSKKCMTQLVFWQAL